VIKAFIKYTPEVLQIKMEGGKLPLHYACEHCKSTKVVNLLLEAYSDGVTVANHNGSIPLHHAIFYQAPLEVLNLLVEAYPESINNKSSRELKRWYGKEQCKFLLHRVCSGG